MFKHLIFRGLVDIMRIFNSSKAEDPSVVKAHLKKANQEAAPVWNDPTIPFTIRVERCKEILDPVVRMNHIDEGEGEFLGIPPSIIKELNRVYKKFYDGADKRILIGQTHEEAYDVQDGYVRKVAHLLRKQDSRFQSRAITCLGRVYGRNAIPLLTVSSVADLWYICQSSFYKRVVSLVGLSSCGWWLPR